MAEVELQNAKRVVEFVWSGQSGTFELSVTPKRREYFTQTEALASLEGKCFFAPLARTRRGSKKVDVSSLGNILWADIDHLDARTWITERLSRYSLKPSAVVFSGQKGFWVYLKLTELVPTDEIERLNEGLATLLDGDRCWNRNRIARLPESVHQSTGRKARIVSFSQTIYTPAQVAPLADLTPERSPKPTLRIAIGRTTRTGAVQYPVPRLGKRARQYMNDFPRKGEGYDRSEEEMRIFRALVGQGWTDDQIISFADAHLPKHNEEHRRLRGYSWTIRSIEKARQHHKGTVSTGSSIGGMCKQSRTISSHLNPREVLKLVDGQSRTALKDEVMARFGGSRSRAYDWIARLKEGDFLQEDETGSITLTAKAKTVMSGTWRKPILLPKAHARPGKRLH